MLLILTFILITMIIRLFNLLDMSSTLIVVLLHSSLANFLLHLAYRGSHIEGNVGGDRPSKDKGPCQAQDWRIPHNKLTHDDHFAFFFVTTTDMSGREAVQALGTHFYHIPLRFSTHKLHVA